MPSPRPVAACEMSRVFGWIEVPCSLAHAAGSMRTFAKRESDAKQEEAAKDERLASTDTPQKSACYAIMMERRSADASGFARLASSKKDEDTKDENSQDEKRIAARSFYNCAIIGWTRALRRVILAC